MCTFSLFIISNNNSNLSIFANVDSIFVSTSTGVFSILSHHSSRNFDLSSSFSLSSTWTSILIPLSFKISLKEIVSSPDSSAALLKVTFPSLYISIAADSLRLLLVSKSKRIASLTTSDLLE